jgi:transcription factor MAFF/G/K
MEAMHEETQRINEEIDSLKGKFEALKKFALSKKITIPPELEMI